jgi:hypothetical protein
VRSVIGPPDFLGDSLGVLLLVERLALEDFALLVARLALEDFAPPLRAEVLRERPVVEPAFCAFPREPPFPTRFVFVWAICPSPKMKSSLGCSLYPKGPAELTAKGCSRASFDRYDQ